jgi:Mn-dependent DtxR family transcriptional regulator
MVIKLIEGIIRKCENGAYELTKKGKQLAERIEITRKRMKKSFIELVSLSLKIDKKQVEEELRKRERAIKKLDARMKKILTEIIRESVRAQNSEERKMLVIKILEEALKKLKENKIQV